MKHNGSDPFDDNRRRLLRLGTQALIASLAAPAVLAANRSAALAASSTEARMPPSSAPFQLAPLPYPESALAPGISAETVGIHHGKHHAGYVDKLNKMLADNPRPGQSLEALIRATHARAQDVGIYNNAAQIWNHDFYWRSMTPKGGGEPGGSIARAIRRDFGSFASLREKLAAAAAGQFGSGWAWLVMRDGRIEVLHTSNADNPLTMGATALLTIDVWEHAYYVDYRNRRADYVSAVIDGLLDWPAAEDRMPRA